MSGVYDFASYAPKGGTITASYKSTSGSPLALVDSATVPPHSNSHTQVLGYNCVFRCSRVEWRAGGPFGVLLAADDLSYADWTAATAAGWGQVFGVSGSVTWTGSEVEIADSSSITCHGIYKLTPAGADTIVARGCWFNDAEVSLHWGMVSPHAIGPDSSGLGGTGYRVLMRDAHPHLVQIVDAIAPAPDPTPSVAGWSIGVVA